MDEGIDGGVDGWRGIVIIVGPLHPMHSDDHGAEYFFPSDDPEAGARSSVSCAPFRGARHKMLAPRLGPFGHKI